MTYTMEERKAESKKTIKYLKKMIHELERGDNIIVSHNARLSDLKYYEDSGGSLCRNGGENRQHTIHVSRIIENPFLSTETEIKNKITHDKPVNKLFLFGLPAFWIGMIGTLILNPWDTPSHILIAIGIPPTLSLTYMIYIAMLEM